jgi:CubicO group peptidase (beta-lactamase class C family)
MTPIRTLALAALAGSLLATASALPLALAQEPPAAARVEPSTLDSLPAFIDGVVTQQIASREVFAAIVTVVHDGEVVMNRGYGFADAENGVRVDPESTLFRPGSISKMFTWIALMQQIEQGRVSLDDDVNDHLDFTIEPFDGQPIRVRDLFAHTPGLSDVGGFTSNDAAELVDYKEWTRRNVPERLWAPGIEAGYSNYGTALAGYIVERVSGEHFADYVERHVFEPLGMTASTFREPLPDALENRIAHGHQLEDGRLTLRPFQYYSLIMPAGSATVSGPDMARFMLAMLNGGELEGARILSPDSVALLETESIANAPNLPGLGHGYLIYREAGPRLIGHAGAMRDFRSNLILAPEAGFGVFLSVMASSPAGLPAQGELSSAITGRVCPQENLAGRYRVNRRDFSREPDPERDLEIAAAGPHALTIRSGEQVVRFEQTGPMMFEQTTGFREGGPHERIEFYGEPGALRMSYASQPFMNWHRLSDDEAAAAGQASGDDSES